MSTSLFNNQKSSTECVKNIKTIRHGSWDFDYSVKNNIYNTDIKSYESKCFNHIVPLNINKTDYRENQLTDKDLEDFRRAALIHK